MALRSVEYRAHAVFAEYCIELCRVGHGIAVDKSVGANQIDIYLAHLPYLVVERHGSYDTVDTGLEIFVGGNRRGSLTAFSGGTAGHEQC